MLMILVVTYQGGANHTWKKNDMYKCWSLGWKQRVHCTHYYLLCSNGLKMKSKHKITRTVSHLRKENGSHDRTAWSLIYKYDRFPYKYLHLYRLCSQICLAVPWAVDEPDSVRTTRIPLVISHRRQRRQRRRRLRSSAEKCCVAQRRRRPGWSAPRSSRHGARSQMGLGMDKGLPSGSSGWRLQTKREGGKRKTKNTGN